MGRRVVGRKLPRLITFDAFGTLFTPREPIAKQYSEVASQLGLSGITESAVQSSFRTGMHTHHGTPTADRSIVDMSMLQRSKMSQEGIQTMGRRRACWQANGGRM